mmetsp:Transcript_9018/g.24993  ORF Transcript_9018/g.24993 Transcript_9018/m.24993 type:complete len:128 (-) Transcript_9018:64-447(-)|eukprot:CAMPEP_0168744950 /NCGR_PEP_ID=MMETSP0724-20121128/14360_1 /TAXON_ID=265536 /ORGANISM="Amphiprora sp., Strain CCMP467" /LENGTH=127 /DNA_ID=CAMNT_0008792635 /DNA_START=146 /DNA_END=529 /DNA_ORIENTATION=+
MGTEEKEPETKKPKTMGTITEGVEFDTIAREWRCKWSADNDKKSLAEAQKLLNSVLDDVKKVDGVTGVQRIVCGGCLDFKVITSVSSDKFGAWDEAKFAPEEEFLGKLGAIDGISTVETQTFTIMPM